MPLFLQQRTYKFVYVVKEELRSFVLLYSFTILTEHFLLLLFYTKCNTLNNAVLCKYSRQKSLHLSWMFVYAVYLIKKYIYMSCCDKIVCCIVNPVPFIQFYGEGAHVTRNV